MVMILIFLFKIYWGRSCMQLPDELRNSKKDLINIQNEDNECFRWCHVRYLNPMSKDAQ